LAEAPLNFFAESLIGIGVRRSVTMGDIVVERELGAFELLAEIWYVGVVGTPELLVEIMAGRTEALPNLWRKIGVGRSPALRETKSL
jgi:hypothetical protein